MKISIISDFHLEMCISTPLPGGDLLLMAGDMFSAHSVAPHRTDADGRKVRSRSLTFCATQLSKYAKVFYVLGNHEHYFGTFETTAAELERFLEPFPNITLLDKEVAEVEGVRILGTTLWSRCGIGRPGAMDRRIGNAMNDFRLIKTTHAPPDKMTLDRKGQRVFQPVDANREHQSALTFLKRELKTGGETPTILLTHHAPSFKSAHGHEYGSEYLDDAYCANLEKLITDHPNIRLAVHGHTHHREHYRIGRTLVKANARGYFPEERSSRGFDPSEGDLEFEDLIHDRL